MQRGVFGDDVVRGIIEKLLQPDGLRNLIACIIVVVVVVVERSEKNGETGTF